MKIVLKGVPPSLNQTAGRANVWEYRENKKKWTEAVQWEVRACKYRPREPLQMASVRITYFFPDARRRDADNYCGKYILDGLTRSGVIADDDFAHIVLTVKGYADRKNPRTEIEVTEIEN